MKLFEVDVGIIIFGTLFSWFKAARASGCPLGVDYVSAIQVPYGLVKYRE